MKRWQEEQNRRRSAAARGREEAVPQPEIPFRGPLSLRIPDPRWGLERSNKAAEAAAAQKLKSPPSASHPQAGPRPAVAISPALPALRQRRYPEPATGNAIDDLTSRPAQPPPATGYPAAALALDFKAAGAVGPTQRPLAGNNGEIARPLELGGTRPDGYPLAGGVRVAELPSLHTIGPAAEPAAAEQTPPPALPAAGRGPARGWRAGGERNAAAEPDTAHEPSPPRDVLAMLPRQALQSAVPGAEGPAAFSVQRRPLQSDLAPPPASQPQAGPRSAAGQGDHHAQDDRHAQVNVDELRSRIEGVNLSLRTLEGELDEKRDLTADQLDSLLSRLDILVLRQKDLALFRGLITPQEQARVGQIDSSRAAVATLGTRIAELRSRVRQNESLREADRTAALKHLDELSDRLATLTAGK